MRCSVRRREDVRAYSREATGRGWHDTSKAPEKERQEDNSGWVGANPMLPGEGCGRVWRAAERAGRGGQQGFHEMEGRFRSESSFGDGSRGE